MKSRARSPAGDNGEMVEHKLIMVFESNNRASMATAKSLLESAGIKYYVKGEDVQSLIGFGAIDGVPEIQVAEEDAKEAKEILKDLA